jgi:hypothetical protein
MGLRRLYLKGLSALAELASFPRLGRVCVCVCVCGQCVCVWVWVDLLSEARTQELSTGAQSRATRVGSLGLQSR